MENENNNWFTDIESQHCDTPPVSTGFLIIDKVAKGSPADKLDLKEFDRILRINKKPADSVDLVQMAINGEPIDYEVYRRQSNSRIVVKTHGLLLGIRALKNSEALVRDIKQAKDNEISARVTLWEREDYEHIRRACSDGSGLFDRFLSFIFNDYLNELMIAICDIEENVNSSQAFSVIRKFEEKHNSDYTTDINSLVYYYRAKEAQNIGDHELLHYYAEYIGSFSPEETRFKTFVSEIDASYLTSASPNEGKKFNASNQLVYLDETKTEVTLQNILDEMPRNFLLPICLMTTYRANGPYHDCIKAYHSVYPYTKKYLFPTLVITDDSVGSKNQNYWLSSEQAVIRAGLPLRVAFDEESRFSWDIELSSAPKFITINKDREIVSDAWLSDDYAYWSLHELIAQSN